MDEHPKVLTALRGPKPSELTHQNEPAKDWTLDTNILVQKKYPTHSLDHLGDGPTKYGLGKLDKLPVELLNSVIIQLNMTSLLQFRRVNKLALQMVTSSPEYKVVQKHAQTALHSITAIECGWWITLKALYETICTSRCENCGDFGGYIYLLACQRVCYLCFAMERAYLPIRYWEALQRTRDRTRLDVLPQATTIKGIYSPKRKINTSRAHLIDFESVFKNSPVSTEGRLRFGDSNPPVVRRRGSPKRTTVPSNPHLDPFRFQAVVQAPYYDNVSKQADAGFLCQACARSRGEQILRVLHPRRRFCVESFADHLKVDHPDIYARIAAPSNLEEDFGLSHLRIF